MTVANATVVDKEPAKFEVAFSVYECKLSGVLTSFTFSSHKESNTRKFFNNRFIYLAFFHKSISYMAYDSIMILEAYKN